MARLRDILRRSLATTLLLVLAAVAVVGAFVSSPVTSALAVMLGALGVAVFILAWCSPVWRRGAGRARHLLVTLAGLVCVSVTVFELLKLAD